MRVRRDFALAWELIAQVDALGLKLATPQGGITWQDRGSAGTTLDLIFLSDTLNEGVLECCVAHEADMASDHFPVATKINISIPVRLRERRSWRNVDPQLLQDCQKLEYHRSFTD
ncbi:hypothetical protein ACJ73_04177 [Blastomyces percursus]|uniref:Endonuclease/exonuclease/phosphatase domain-containing protein n=1 Tax=Blastomyces percursus TaxID=1658174 RepID=A0A1J9QW69_9EURO|nr:hypothetical protein ACJ73_04177 [Blastomyces percursus]